MNQHPALNHDTRLHRLSVVMIVKNEAKNLELSLPALHGWIDELIVLDSGSTDHGRQLVEDAGGQWYENLNWPGFGKQRQIAQSFATGEWILALDADEVVTEELKHSILAAIQQPPAQTVFGIKRLDCIFGHQIDNAFWPVKAHWRLYPKSYQYNDNLVHESVDLKHNRAEQTFQDSLKLTHTLKPVDQTEKKSTVSLVMIAKNESKHLAACLDTVHDLVDEIIILDSGSTDATRTIAEQYGAKWYVNTDWQGFGIQRQLAQSYASKEYVIVLDPDERLDQSLREAIVEVLKQPVQHDKVFTFARVNQFCGVEVQKRFWYTDKLARLYANQSFKYSSLEVHESLDQKNVPSIRLTGYLAHLTNDDLHHFLVKNIRYSHDWASDKYKHGKQVTLFSSVLRAIFSFIREYIIRGDFIGGAYGYLLAMASMGYTLDKYLMLWQMNKEKK